MHVALKTLSILCVQSRPPFLPDTLGNALLYLHMGSFPVFNQDGHKSPT